MIPAAEMLAMRQVAQQSLDLTCTVSRYHTATDSVGGVTESWVADAGPIGMRLGDAKGPELEELAHRAEARGIEYIGTWSHIATYAAPDMRDRLACSDGHTYEVVARLDAPSYTTASRMGLRRLS